jgi:hypothetical protein
MRRPTLRLPVHEGGPLVSIVRSLAIAATTLGVGLGGVALAPPATATAGDPLVVNCLGKGQVKPKQITLACADAGVFVYKITWTRWDANGARGSGILVWNTCLPKTCVDGIVQKFAVKVRLGRVASGPSIDVFSGMTLMFPGASGPASAETSTYTLDNQLR